MVIVSYTLLRFRFVFVTEDPPTMFFYPFWDAKNFFNWTATYRRDSDIDFTIAKKKPVLTNLVYDESKFDAKR